jgi:hypothetical protein
LDENANRGPIASEATSTLNAHFPGKLKGAGRERIRLKIVCVLLFAIRRIALNRCRPAPTGTTVRADEGDEMTAWMVRAGKAGEREQWALERGVTGAGFGEVADLTEARTREQVHDAVAAAYPKDKPLAVRNFAAQMWALRDRMSKGDVHRGDPGFEGTRLSRAITEAFIADPHGMHRLAERLRALT